MLKRLGVPLVVVLISSACADADKDTPTAPDGAAPRSVQTLKSERKSHRTLDERFARVDSVADGFAGMFLDEGTLVIRRKPARATQASIRAAVETEFGRDMDLAGVPVRFESAHYGWLELNRWFESLRGLLGTGLAHSLDIAEDRNRIVVWIQPDMSVDAVLREIETRGVPREAVKIEARLPAKTRVSLQDRVRPLWGGLRITRSDQGYCTLGFLAKDGFENPYFVTASHCTYYVAAPDGTIFYQNTPSANNRVGFEIHDPYTFACTENEYYGCRYSDAALIAIDDGVWWDFGGIARTTSVGSITLDQQSGWFFEISSHGLAILGMELSMIGSESGWTTGTVTNTCQTTAPLGGGFTRICQVRVTGNNADGDSGAPVIIPDLVNGTATLFGILWGGRAGWYYYSPIFNVLDDLGWYYTFEGGSLPG
jgi:hypothetical protein